MAEAAPRVASRERQKVENEGGGVHTSDFPRLLPLGLKPRSTPQARGPPSAFPQLSLMEAALPSGCDCSKNFALRTPPPFRGHGGIHTPRLSQCLVQRDPVAQPAYGHSMPQWSRPWGHPNCHPRPQLLGPLATPASSASQARRQVGSPSRDSLGVGDHILIYCLMANKETLGKREGETAPGVFPISPSSGHWLSR